MCKSRANPQEVELQRSSTREKGAIYKVQLLERDGFCCKKSESYGVSWILHMRTLTKFQ